VDTRPPPPITIEGGPGWTTDPTSGDTIVAEPDDAAPGRPGRRRQVTALLLAAALGFGAATLLAERRQSVLDASPDGVLSLDVASREPQFSPDLVELDGGLAVQATVQLRNTGPRDIALEAVELEGTGFAAVDVAGRRLAARPGDGGAAAACGPLRGPRAAGLGGSAAGPRDDGRRSAHRRAAAGHPGVRASRRASPGRPADCCRRTSPWSRSRPRRPSSAAGRAEVRVALSSASSSALVVQSLELPPGLRLASLTGVEGTDVTLPLRLPPGDYDPPTQPMLGRGQEQSLVAVLEVVDCAALPARAAEQYLPLFQAAVTDERGRSQGATDGFYGGFGVGGTAWGDPAVVDRLRASSCPARESALTTVPPGRP
jgi:hypothetical protein